MLNQNERSADIIIPAHVARSDLSVACKYFYGELRLLCLKSGYCFPSNDWLAEHCGESTRNVMRFLDALEARHLIKRERGQTPNGKIRRLIFIDIVKNQPIFFTDEGDKTVTPRVTKLSPPTCQNCHPDKEYIYNINNSMNKRLLNKRLIIDNPYTPPLETLSNPLPLAGEKDTAEAVGKTDTNTGEVFGEFKNIVLSQNEYYSLVEKFGKEFLTLVIEEYSAYLNSSPRARPPANGTHYSQILCRCYRRARVPGATAQPKNEKNEKNSYERTYTREELNALYDVIGDGV